MRLAGLALLALLLIRLDFGRIRDVLRAAGLGLIALAVLGEIPLIALKTVRWQGILRAQSVRLGFWPALLAYFGSLFVGFLTPGRLGEFVKALHVYRDCETSRATAFASVLADRLFDLYALLVVGSLALLALALGEVALLALGVLVLVLTVPLALFLHGGSFTFFQRIGLRLGTPGRKLFAAEDGALVAVRDSLRQLTLPWTLIAIALTVLAYGVFFGQCYLLARSLDLSISFGTVAYAVALGSLVTLIPVSISGLGTREAAMIAYLDTAGVAAEAAISFSLLVFVTFYIAGGLIGAVAWWIKPVPLRSD